MRSIAKCIKKALPNGRALSKSSVIIRPRTFLKHMKHRHLCKTSFEKLNVPIVLDNNLPYIHNLGIVQRLVGHSAHLQNKGSVLDTCNNQGLFE